MSFTTAQLDAFWARYVTMRQGDVITVSRDEPQFAAMLCYVMQNRLYGFSDYTGSPAFPDNGGNKYFGGSGIHWIGPILS
jgi:hypothetical protein